MPSNRQGDTATAADTATIPKEIINTNSANKRFEFVIDCTESEKVEFIGMTKTPNSFKETLYSEQYDETSGKMIDLTPLRKSFS